MKPQHIQQYSSSKSKLITHYHTYYTYCTVCSVESFLSDIHSVQPSASHLHGGEPITIGIGLNCGAVVDIDGVPYKVIRSNFEEVKCVTGAKMEEPITGCQPIGLHAPLPTKTQILV